MLDRSIRAVGFCSLVLALVLLPSAARAQDAKPQDVAQEVRELRDEVKQLRMHQQELEEKLQAASQPDPAAVARTVDGVLHDAESRGHFLDLAGSGAGYDPETGFFARSDDGNFLLHPFVLLQFRNTTNYREHASGSGDDTQNGFEVRRLQLGANGNVFTPDLTYRVFIQTDREDVGTAKLFDAFVKYHFADTPWSIQAGQFKAPFDHEQRVPDRLLLAADRTLVDDILANGEAFSDGVTAFYDPGDAFRAQFDFTNGYNVNNTTFEEPPARPDHFGVGGRAEYKLFGNWKDYDRFTSLGATADLLVIGAGVDYTEGAPGDAIRHVIDAQWNRGPLGLYGSYIGRYTARNGAAGDTYDSGVRLQASYLIQNRIEPYARYDYLHLDPREFPAGTRTSVNEFTAGVNYYIYGQGANITLDVLYLPQGSPVGDEGSGVFADNGHNELVFRAQLQLAI